jgi:hypothetical protein
MQSVRVEISMRYPRRQAAAKRRENRKPMAAGGGRAGGFELKMTQLETKIEIFETQCYYL